MTPWLLDTVTIIRLAATPEAVPAEIRRHLDDPDRPIIISVVSLWEVAVKQALGKLSLPVSLEHLLDPWRKRENIRVEPLSEAAVVRVVALPPVHRDPFDRMPICQAIELSAEMVSPDEVLDAYPVIRRW